MRGVFARTRLYVRGVRTHEEVETHQVVAGAEPADVAVIRAAVQAFPPSALLRHITLEAQLALGLELAGKEEAALLQQKHQVLAHGPLHGVPHDDHKLVAQQLPDFASPQVGRGGGGQAGGLAPAFPRAGQRRARGKGRSAREREGGAQLGAGITERAGVSGSEEKGGSVFAP